jgi:outer membrane protein assembly factor BamB
MTSTGLRRVSCLCALALVVAGATVACGGRTASNAWTSANGGVASQRSVTATRLDAKTIPQLTVRWRFRLNPKGQAFGAITSNPIIRGNTVYVQDAVSSIYALDARSGALRWKHAFAAPNDGPNGLTVAGSRLYSATDTTAFALDANTGRLLWGRRLTNQFEQFVGIAPVVDRGRVYVSTQGVPPRGRGALYALSAATGKIVWRFQTIKEPWAHPDKTGGGGAWNPVSVDERGNVYAGIANPAPWGGSTAFPNGAWFAGPALYTDSLVVLAGPSGKLLWYDQVTRHDVRDHDFQASPVLATVDARPVLFGAGKGGRVVAWDRKTRTRIWTRAVGTHLHDLGPLPVPPTRVCPGLLGGVETPMAYADGRVFVPVVDLCVQGSAVMSPNVTILDPASGKGRLVALDGATGRTLWDRRLPSPNFGCATVSNDVVFTSTFDGTVYALHAEDGAVIWRAHMRAGINACAAVAGDLLLVGAGVRRSSSDVPELIAFR